MATETTKDKKPAAKKTVAKKTTRSTAAKAPAKKPAAPKVTTPKAAPAAQAAPEAAAFQKPTLAKGKYIFATGRRKTAVANVRLFAGNTDSLVNQKKFEVYFGQSSLRDNAIRPLALTGLMGDFYFSANVNGGGIIAQAEAIRHGIAQALASMNNDLKTVLKKNGFLTRDDRKKERKKPGLRRARRAPQWAKR
jgi:small subunit ribosomal protein S9